MPMESSLGGLTTTRLQTSGTLMRPSGPARLNLHIIRTGQILPLAGPGEFIVGRVSSGQSILPDVDLEPYAAYESGVSRLHARIRIQAEEILITDLGSANGTRLNNDKLAPHQPYSIQNKDVLRFGRLSVQALTGD
ncbi:MAG: FHA domain-containing protein [Anaerolineales bacterium]|nr:FHA domain-containing protein [Anaerolineales bacterium]